MRRCEVTDAADTGMVTVAFTFDGHDARELAEIVGLVQLARGLAQPNNRLALELDAHYAYFTVLEQGPSRRSTCRRPPNSELARRSRRTATRARRSIRGRSSLRARTHA